MNEFYDEMFNNMTRWLQGGFIDYYDLNDLDFGVTDEWEPLYIQPLKSEIDLLLSTWHSGSIIMIPISTGGLENTIAI